jgi:hypothetical protein
MYGASLEVQFLNPGALIRKGQRPGTLAAARPQGSGNRRLAARSNENDHPVQRGHLPRKMPTQAGAGEGNRTLITSLEGWSSTIELHPHSSSGFSSLGSAAWGRGFSLLDCRPLVGQGLIHCRAEWAHSRSVPRYETSNRSCEVHFAVVGTPPPLFRKLGPARVGGSSRSQAIGG